MHVSHVFLDISRSLLGNLTFTIRHGVAKGFKRRYGLGFIPSWKETKEDIFIRSLNLEGKTVFDIGAYVGLYSLFFSSRVGEKGRVFAFEPNPMNFAELNYNLSLNGFTKTKTIMAAVGDAPGKLDMVVSRYLTSRGSLDKNWQSTADDSAQKISVDVVTIDSLVKNGTLPKPDFVKIDVEAFELAVIKGMKNTLSTHAPTLWVEIHGPLTRELLDELFQYDYHISHLELGQDIVRGTVPDVVHGHLYCVKK